METETQETTERKTTPLTAYEPYRREAKYCLIIDIVIDLLVALLLLTSGLLILLPVVLLFVLAEYLLNHRLTAMSKKEMRQELFTTQTVSITAIKESHSASGLWGSVLRELYPKELHVGRYQLLCRTADGQKLTLRGIWSEKKGSMIHDAIDRKQLTACTVIYGAKTHIVLDFGTENKLCDELNHKF